MNASKLTALNSAQWFRGNGWLKFCTAVCFVAFAIAFGATEALAQRYPSSLPHSEKFDANNYSELVWLQRDCTHTWVANGGWRGGAAKFTPPLAGEGYCGLGQFHVRNSANVGEQLNVRFLVYYGSTWVDYGHGSKLFILNRDGNGGRPMVITRQWPYDSTPWETWGACDGTVCEYEGGDYWPDGSDSLRIGNSPLAREEQWMSVELEANVRTGRIRLYVTTQDGDIEGLYVEQTMNSSGTGGTWAFVDILGGYMAASARAHPDNYYMIDEVVVDSRYIGPPAGFGTGTPPPPPPAVPPSPPTEFAIESR